MKIPFFSTQSSNHNFFFLKFRTWIKWLKFDHLASDSKKYRFKNHWQNGLNFIMITLNQTERSINFSILFTIYGIDMLRFSLSLCHDDEKNTKTKTKKKLLESRNLRVIVKRKTRILCRVKCVCVCVTGRAATWSKACTHSVALAAYRQNISLFYKYLRVTFLCGMACLFVTGALSPALGPLITKLAYSQQQASISLAFSFLVRRYGCDFLIFCCSVMGRSLD